jgi:gliding motility-associated lipoprotein GldD
MRLFSFIVLVFMISLLACEEKVQVPKPRMYPKISFPEKAYETYNPANCPFVFDIPKYARAEQDTLFFDERPPNDCWTNIYFPDFNGQLYCSYYPVRNKQELEKLISDGHKISSKHIVRADFIDELPISKSNRVYGVLFSVQGASASGLQFYLTDSTRHFFLASLYFDAAVRPDSIKPVLSFIEQDIYQLIESFEWKK